MLMNKRKLNGFRNADEAIIPEKPVAAVNQPVSEPAESVSELMVCAGKDFSSLVKEGFTTFHIVGFHASGFPVFKVFFIAVSDLRTVVINAGRQLLMICVHKAFLLVNMLIMSAKMLSVPSDRGRQTYRSENVQTVTGILFPTAVRPAPFFLSSHSQVSGSQRGRVRHG